MYFVVVLLSLLVFAAYDDRATTGSLEQLCGSFLLLLLYGAAVIPLGYSCSFGFASPSAAQACHLPRDQCMGTCLFAKGPCSQLDCITGICNE